MIVLQCNVPLLFASHEIPRLFDGVLGLLALKLTLIYLHDLVEVRNVDSKGMPSLQVQVTRDYHHVILGRLQASQIDKGTLELNLSQMVLSAVVVPVEGCLGTEK